MRVYIIRIFLNRRLWKYKIDLKLSLFSQSDKAMKFENFKFYRQKFLKTAKLENW
jgi:hypothetical protein